MKRGYYVVATVFNNPMFTAERRILSASAWVDNLSTATMIKLHLGIVDRCDYEILDANGVLV